MTHRTHDVVVVGGGPAGAAAAIGLADHGLDVVVLDKATFPRDKTCGDGLTTLALRELERLDFDPATVPSWTAVSAACLHSPGHRTVTLPLPDGPGLFAAIAPRLELDAALLTLADDRGASLRCGVSLRGAEMHADHVVLHTDGRDPLSARWVIGADGAWSPLRKALGLSEHRYRGEWHAVRQYLRTDEAAARDLHVWFEPDLLPGYAWSFPLPDGRTNVGFGVLRNDHTNGATLARLWSELLQRPAIRSVLGQAPASAGAYRSWPIPAKVTDTVLGAGRALFVGDAARATDLFTGEGIGQALLTGRLAATAITAAPDADPVEVSQAYTQHVLDELRPDHRMASALSTVLSNRWAAEAAIAIVGTNGWTRRNVARWLFEDSPRGIALTPRRWHRGALSGPAAYSITPRRGTD